MWSLQSFSENSAKRKAARQAQQEHALNMATMNRDLYGPAYTAKGRRKDMSLLKKNRPSPMTDPKGNPYSPIKESDTVMQGDSKSSQKRRKALPKYNATRGMTKRPW